MLSHTQDCRVLVTSSSQEQDCVTRDTSSVLDTHWMCVLLHCVGVLSLEPRTVQSAQRVWLWASCHLAPSLASLAETHLQSWNPDREFLLHNTTAALSTLRHVAELANVGRDLWPSQECTDKECSICYKWEPKANFYTRHGILARHKRWALS